MRSKYIVDAKYLNEITGGELTIWQFALRAMKLELSDAAVEANIMSTETNTKV